MPRGPVTYRRLYQPPPLWLIDMGAADTELPVANYPNAYDEFIPVATDGDYHVSLDYNHLSTAVLAAQIELGLQPAGSAGTLASRLFFRYGNLAPKAGGAGWARTAWGWFAAETKAFYEGDPQVILDLSAIDFDANEDAGFGAGLPIVFLVMGRRNDLVLPSQWYLNGPWRHTQVDTFFRQNLQLSFAARTLSGANVGSTDTIPVRFGYLAINWKL